MSETLPGLVSIGIGTVLLLLGRWGLRRGEALVSPHLAAARREREIRSIARGSRSCIVLGGLFFALGAAMAVTGVVP